MSLNVDALCAALDNRLDHRLMFEGKVVRGLHRRESVCRQLYDRWLSMGGKHSTYDLFKKSLRFRVNNGWVMASVKYDPTPVIAAGVAGLGLTAAGLGAYQYLKKPKPLISNLPNTNANLKPIVWTPGPEDKWRDASGDLRPGVFRNMGNSCYFHSAMLMLFQMRDWFRATVRSTIEDEVKHGSEEEMLKNLEELLSSMETNALLGTELIGPVYKNVQGILFPNEPPNRQQDANEFFMRLFGTMQRLGLSMDGIGFKSVSTLFDPAPDTTQQIRSLEIGGLPIEEKLVDKFFNEWLGFDKESPEYKLTNWTLENEQFVARTQKDKKSPGYQDEVSVGNDYNFNPQDIVTTTSSRTNETQPMYVLNVYLPPTEHDICKIVERTNSGQDTPGNLRIPGDLFNSKTKIHEKYEFEERDYYLVLMKYYPGKTASKFTYCDMITLGAHQYSLDCIIFRMGGTGSCGHFTAALNINSQWVYYDDSPPKRKLTTLDELSDVRWAVPFMLLFNKSPPIE